jgi:hypothetical protein
VSLDFFIAACIALLGIVLTGLGWTVTIHPPVTSRSKTLHKVAFVVCGTLMFVLVLGQSLRNEQSQRDLTRSIATVQGDERDAKRGQELTRIAMAKLQDDEKSERIRRQQAERDLALIVQASAQSTRLSVSDDIRKLPPVKVEVKGQPGRNSAENRTIREDLGEYMRRGSALRDRCYTDGPDTKLDAEAAAWYEEVRSYLGKTLDKSYVEQFAVLTPTAFTPNGVPAKRLNLWTALNQKVQDLSKFIDQLK